MSVHVSLANDRCRCSRLDSPSRCQWNLRVVSVLLLALIYHGARVHAPVPSIDHYLYVPFSWSVLDPRLFPRDLMLRENHIHSIIWPMLVWLSQMIGGVGIGFWCATVVLGVLTVCAVDLLFRSLNVPMFVVPVALVIPVFADPTVVALGRGIYGGIFGDSFHAQWLALLCLLFAYNAFISKQPVRCGVFAALAFLSHPTVGVHGGFVLALASLLSLDRKGLFACAIRGGLPALFLSLPVLVYVIPGVLATTPQDWNSLDFAEKAYLFRIPHEFLISVSTPPSSLRAMFITTIAAATALLVLLREQNDPTLTRLAGIWLGQFLLFLLAYMAHGPLHSLVFRHLAPVVFLLHLTRTTPLHTLLSTVTVFTAIHSLLSRGAERRSWGTWVGVALLGVSIGVAVMSVRTSGWLLGSLALAGVLFLAEKGIVRKRLLRDFAAMLAVLLFVLFAALDCKEVRATGERDELYGWITQATELNALFIVPPSMGDFRYYAKRSIYVDFRFIGTSNLLIPEWRRRLEEIALPDEAARNSRGYPGLSQWDRTYAERNDSRRIVELLKRTSADYFVLDKSAVTVPTASSRDRDSVQDLQEVFSNAQFVVYAMRK